MKFKDLFVGQVIYNKRREAAVIKSITSSRSIEIEFQDKYKHVANLAAHQIFTGGFTNPYYASIDGVGFLGVGEYKERTHRPIYTCWRNLIKRTIRDGHKMSTKWYNFQEFAKWYESVVPDYRTVLYYSGTTANGNSCMFMPLAVKTMFAGRKASGKYPLGVAKDRTYKKFKSQIWKERDHFCVGFFDTINEAHEAYMRSKKDYIKYIVNKYALPPRAITFLLERLEQAKTNHIYNR